MPGLTGLSAAQAPALLDKMARELVREPWLVAHRLVPDDPGPGVFACLALAHSDMAGVAERGDAGLAVAGWVLNTEATGARLADWLLARFLAAGERFVERLTGSFQIAVHQRGTTWVYVDPLGSRRLFYAELGDGLCFSPEAAPLMALLGRAAPDPANLVQFLISGRFFAGGTALAPLRQLLPGEYLVHGPRLVRRRYFRYEIRPDAGAAAPEEAAERLAALLESAILRAWQRARCPAFLLSGGYDSRFIFYTVARAVDDTTRLRTLLWGAHPERPHSDTWTAAAIARRFGTRHLELGWSVDRVPERFATMFRAQSGMTEQTFTHVDELYLCRALRCDHGIESIFRGDEIFGPKGGEVASVREALERLSMSRTSRVADRQRWLSGGEAYLQMHAEHLEELLAAAPSAAPDLRDTLYARERLPALQHHLGYHRSHHVETYNPLLDLDVVRFYRGVRAVDRLDKRLFRTVFERRFGHHLDIPIASRDNSVDLARAVRESRPLAAFLRRALATLPAPFDRTYFGDQLESVIRGEPAAATTPGVYRVPPLRLVIRAVILARWLNRWGS